MKLRIKIFDILIILLVLGIIIFSLFWAYAPRGERRVLVRGQGREWIFPMGTDETVVVQGPIGDTVVRIGGERAWVESSPCENQTCVASGFVSRQGQWAACLPNGVLIMIEGADGDVDVIAW